MVFQLGKTTVLRSLPGEKANREVTVTGMTSAGFAIVTPAERDGTDRRGQMDFYVVPGTNIITIYSEEKELQADTDVYWFACDNEIPGSLLEPASVMAASLGSDVSSLTGVDDSTIEVSGGDLRVKDLGITAAKLAATLDLSGKTITLANGAVPVTKLEGLADGEIAIGVDGTGANNAKVTVIGDATLANDGTLTIANDAVTSAKLEEGTIQIAEVDITAADIVAMYGAPVVLLASPGTHKVIQFISAVLIYDFDTLAYTGGGDITINATGGTAVSNVITSTNGFAASGDTIFCVGPAAFTELALPEDTGLTITNATGAFVNAGTAAGVGRLKLAYRVISTDLA